MNNVGIFLKPGGNKVFFVNGVLKVFAQEGIKVDHLIGYSSSSAILFAHLFSCHDFIVDIFGHKLKNNKKNFYLCRKNKFPHTDIYKGAVQEMFLQEHVVCDNNTSYVVIATKTSKAFMKIKGLIATISLILEKIGVKAIPFFKSVCKVSDFCYDSRYSHKLSTEQLINLIVGSSTIYPFITLHTLENFVILDGAIATVDPMMYLHNFSKKIIIHTKMGETRIEDNVLHIYSSQKISHNILDYTDDSAIRILHKNGENDARKNIDLIKKYILT